MDNEEVQKRKKREEIEGKKSRPQDLRSDC